MSVRRTDRPLTPRLLPALLGVVFLAATAGVSAQIYKWKDADGRWHASDQPPPDAKTPVTTVRGRTPGQSGAATSAPANASAPASGSAPIAQSGPKTWRDQDLEYKQRKAAEQEAAAKKADEAAREADRKRMCDNMRGHLAAMERGGRVAQLDAKGDPTYLDDAAIKREADSLRSRIAKECK